MSSFICLSLLITDRFTSKVLNNLYLIHCWKVYLLSFFLDFLLWSFYLCVKLLHVQEKHLHPGHSRNNFQMTENRVSNMKQDWKYINSKRFDELSLVKMSSIYTYFHRKKNWTIWSILNRQIARPDHWKLNKTTTKLKKRLLKFRLINNWKACNGFGCICKS